MANDLTGEFDVVAEFATQTVNRVLAGMHRAERFPHSITVRVDDTPHVHPGVNTTSIVAVMDGFGDPVVNHQRIGRPQPLVFEAASANRAYALMDPVVNFGTAGFEVPPIVPSNLQGRAQLQLFPPTLEIPDSSGTNVTVRLELISRYFPDPNTSRPAEFVRGDLKITAAVDQVVSQSARIVGIDIRSQTSRVQFTPHWSSRPLTLEDRAGIDLLIGNALRTSFLPSNSSLPSNIEHLQFKTMSGAQGAVAMLLNITGDAGNRATANNVFLAAGDDFALGVSAEFIKSQFAETLDSILTQPIAPVVFQRSTFIHTWTITYTITLNSATVDLENDRIVMKLTGHAHTGTSWMPDFNFTVRQALTLAVAGNTAELVVGDISLDTSSWVINLFKGGAISSMTTARDSALDESNVRETVRQKLSADEQLGGFLRSLMAPARGQPVTPANDAYLAYTSAEIRPSGIVLHGTLGVAEWPPPRVEFELLPVDSQGFVDPSSVFAGPDYSALKSWVPGGTVDRYEWSSQGEGQPGYSDANRFVLLHQPPSATDAGMSARVVSAHTPLCLTVHGTRISASGPAAPQSVAASVCAFGTFPIVAGEALGFDGSPPLVALAHAGAGGRVEVLGHVPASVDRSGGGTPNLVVQFAGAAQSDRQENLLQALSESERRDATTAVLFVAPRGQLDKVRYVKGVTYAEHDSGWERRFDVSPARGPVTLIVEPGGKTVWRRDGELDSRTLAAALRDFLVARSPVRAALQPAGARIGQPPPNFLFEHAPGKQVTLRKLTGRPTVLVFCNPSSKQSVDAVRHAPLEARGPKGGGQLILAILDGEGRDAAHRVSAELGSGIPVVPDPERRISRAYGVAMWPTIVTVDKDGIVRAVNYGTKRITGTEESR